ncbi:MAG: hypothetical protein JXL80_09985 [Planctomycetes bacterium]|nr:hypothetical protein [Planctomycetota bacterium]
MSNKAVFFASESRVPVVSEPVFRIMVDGHWRAALRPVRYEQRVGDVPRLVLELDVGRALDESERWLPESVLWAAGPEQLVTVDLMRGTTLGWRGGGTVRLFEGYVDGPEFGYDARAERTSLVAVDRSHSLLASRVGGQYVNIEDEDATCLSGLDLVFNPDGRPNMSSEDDTPADERPRRLFVAPDSETAETWSAAEAANYLLAFYGAADWLDLPTRGELSDLLGDEPIENVRLEGRSLLEALEILGRRRGLRVTVALSQDASEQLTRTLVFVGRGLGRRVSLYHQMPEETYDRQRTFLERLDARIAWSESLARIELVGDVEVFESTFELLPGWDPAMEDEDPTAYRRSSNASFNGVTDVFRKWVLNEAGDYNDEPYELDGPYDFSGMFGTTAYLPRRRRLLPSISTDALGQSRGVHVELSYDDGETWLRYEGPVRVLRDECGIYLAGDGLAPALYRAAKTDQLRCRVTAAVESDSRLQVVAERDGLQDEHRGRRRWVDVSSDYHRRVVCSSSIFAGGSSRAVDDTEALQALADELFEADRYAPVSAKVTLPTFSTSYRVGDAVDGIRYRYAWLKRDADGIESDPYVESVAQRFTDEGWRTELTLI